MAVYVFRRVERRTSHLLILSGRVTCFYSLFEEGSLLRSSFVGRMSGKIVRYLKELYYRYTVNTALNMLFPNEQLLFNLIILLLAYPIIRLAYIPMSLALTSLFNSVMS